MPVSESQRRAYNKYYSANWRQVKLSMPNDEAERLEAFCKAHGYTKAGFIRDAIKKAMEAENDV